MVQLILFTLSIYIYISGTVALLLLLFYLQTGAIHFVCYVFAFDKMVRLVPLKKKSGVVGSLAYFS